MTKQEIKAAFKRVRDLAAELVKAEQDLPEIDHWCDVVGDEQFGKTPAEAILSAAKWGYATPSYYEDES